MAPTRPWSTARAAAASTWPPSSDTPPSWPTLSPRDRWGEPEETKAKNRKRFSWLFSSHRVPEFERDYQPHVLRRLRPPVEGALCRFLPALVFPLLQDVDMMDQNGMTPLMWAAYRTHRCVYVLCCYVCVSEVPVIGTGLDSALILIWLGDFIFHILGSYNLYIAHPFFCCLYHLTKTSEGKERWINITHIPKSNDYDVDAADGSNVDKVLHGSSTWFMQKCNKSQKHHIFLVYIVRIYILV